MRLRKRFVVLAAALAIALVVVIGLGVGGSSRDYGQPTALPAAPTADLATLSTDGEGEDDEGEGDGGDILPPAPPAPATVATASGDTTKPSTWYATPTHGAVVNDSAMISIGYHDDVLVDTVRVQIVAQSYDETFDVDLKDGTLDIPVSSLGLADGYYTVRTVVTDTAGNDSVTSDRQFQLDATAPTTYWQLAPPALVAEGVVVPVRLRAQGEADGTVIDKSILLDGGLLGNFTTTHRNYDYRLDTTGLADGEHELLGVAIDEAGNRAEATVTFVVDGTGPTITVKPGMSTGGPGAYSQLSLKLFDAHQVDYVVVNGVTKELTDNNWSDVNFIGVGSFGIADGVPFDVVAYDVLGNSSTATFVIDATGPTITVKSDMSVGGPGVYGSLSLKLFDAHQVDYVVVNGVTKELTDNNWSDVNFIRVGSFGIQDRVPFDVVAYDVAGNASAVHTFVLDGTGPVVTVKPDSVGGPDVYTSLSLKLYDPAKVDSVLINGVPKDLTDNAWSDVNFLTVGKFGIAAGVPFDVVAYDVLGNASTTTFTLENAPAAS